MKAVNAIAAIMAAAITAPVAGAQAAPAATEPGFSVPHTGWGVVDLQGFWSNASLTTMQRPAAASKLVVSEMEAKALAAKDVYTAAQRQEAGRSKVDDKSSKELLADGNANRAYNRFWMDPGTSIAMVRGEFHTSWITSTPDGKIPYSNTGVSANTRQSGYDGPEVRPLSERCIMSFTGSYGPVLNNGMYNNTYQIVQSPNAVMILAEMIHDAKVVPIFPSKAEAKHGPAVIPKWGGDAVGWYEGDTLVIETINSHPKQRSFISTAGKTTERFTRWSDGQIFYQFNVEDPTLYTTTWSGEMGLNATQQPIYEYACHEGNYALPGILAGARQLERQGRKQPVEKPIFAGVDTSDGE
jgi:hypothetical protein